MTARPDPRFKISPDRLEHLAFTTPKATVEFTSDVAYLSGFPIPFWAELEPVSA